MSFQENPSIFFSNQTPIPVRVQMRDMMCNEDIAEHPME